MTSIENQTPVEIDTEINRLVQEVATAQAHEAQQQKLARSYKERGLHHDAAVAAARASEYSTQAFVAGRQLDPLYAEFNRRGGWTRFYLVTNSNGHVHWTRSCTTTYEQTDFAWLTQFSGTSHEDLVELAGEKACTVCFPDAPVDVLRRPSKLTTPEREAREAEKAAKAAEKAKSEVVVPNYHDGNASVRMKVFKTVRGATNDIASNLNSMVHYGPTHPTFPYWSNDVDNTIGALVAKGEIADGKAYFDEALEKQRKKVRADHKKFMASSHAAMYRAQGVLNPEADEPDYDPVKF